MLSCWGCARLSQKSFAALLGMSEATINRHENGCLQEVTHDNILRACESSDYVRDLLTRRGNVLSARQREQVEQALAGQAPLPANLESRNR